MFPRLFALSLALASAGALHATTTPGQPPLTRQTLGSGGTMPAEQARLHFDHAQLHFAVDPARRHLDGQAILRFTARQPTDVLLLDLDRNLPVSAIAVNGKPLARDSWSNPDGRLRIHLPTPLRQGASVSTTIVYAGQPHGADDPGVPAPPEASAMNKKSPAQAGLFVSQCGCVADLSGGVTAAVVENLPP